MSIIYCEKHCLRWDSDFQEECERCQIEAIPSARQEKCSVCDGYYPYPVCLHHAEDECALTAAKEQK